VLPFLQQTIGITQGARQLQILVRDNNVDQALRVLKKKMQREGVFREMKRRRYYEKPSVRATREKAEAVRRMRKLARKQAIREGLIAAPKKKIEAGRDRRPGAAPMRSILNGGEGR
jgi:small subunit ribosomal protein S21